MGNKGHEGVREIKGKVQVIYRSHSPQRSYKRLANPLSPIALGSCRE